MLFKGLIHDYEQVINCSICSVGVWDLLLVYVYHGYVFQGLFLSEQNLVQKVNRVVLNFHSEDLNHLRI